MKTFKESIIDILEEHTQKCLMKDTNNPKIKGECKSTY